MDFNLHQDNDPKHTSIICKEILEINKVRWVKISNSFKIDTCYLFTCI